MVTARERAAAELLGPRQRRVASTEQAAARRSREVALEEPVALGGQPGQRRADRVAVRVVGPGEEDEEAGLAHDAACREHTALAVSSGTPSACERARNRPVELDGSRIIGHCPLAVSLIASGGGLA